MSESGAGGAARYGPDDALRQASAGDELIERFRFIAAVHAIRRWIRGMCAFIIFIAALPLAAIIISFATGAGSAYSAAVAAICAMIILGAAASVLRPTPILAMLPAWGFIALTAIVVVKVIAAGGPYASMTIPLIASIFMVIFIVRLHKVKDPYRVFTASVRAPALLDEARRVLSAIMKADPRRDERAVEMTQVTLIDEYRWKGILLADAAIFVRNKGRATLVARRGEIGIDTELRRRPRRHRMARMTIQNQVLKVRIPDESRQRLEKWIAPQLSSMSSPAAPGN